MTALGETLYRAPSYIWEPLQGPWYGWRVSLQTLSISKHALQYLGRGLWFYNFSKDWYLHNSLQ